ncbi:MAG: hypothetical protein Q8J89_02030 [Caulobacter sp.]|nr:hypothetical protein [Caulobacter sp.]
MTIAKLRYADTNLARTAVLTGGLGTADHPLDNLKDDSRFRGAPARCEDPNDLEAATFQAVLPSARAVDLIVLLFHTLEIDARYRITVAGPDGDLDTPAIAGAWSPVYGSVFDSEDLEYEDDNWFFGQLAVEDIDLFPRHLWIWLPQPVITAAIRIELDDSGNAAGFFDIGGLAIARTQTTELNIDRGRLLGITARDQKDESPSGRVFAEERMPRREITVSWSRLQDEEAYRLFDAGMRGRSNRMVLIAPNLADPRSTLREAFPATFSRLPGPSFTWPGLGRVEATLQEIVA